MTKYLKVLVGCEFSGLVRDAFLSRGHEAISCDLVESERAGPHIQDDVLNVIGQKKFDLGIFFPPCDYICRAGARWINNDHKRKLQSFALDFVRSLMAADIPKIAIENPIGCISTQIRPPDQVVHPWQFGHAVNKTTCLWLKNLPKLTPTNVVPEEKRLNSIHNAPDSKNRKRNRSRTFQGIANAMADQWGGNV